MQGQLRVPADGDAGLVHLARQPRAHTAEDADVPLQAQVGVVELPGEHDAPLRQLRPLLELGLRTRLSLGQGEDVLLLRLGLGQDRLLSPLELGDPPPVPLQLPLLGLDAGAEQPPLPALRLGLCPGDLQVPGRGAPAPAQLGQRGVVLRRPDLDLGGAGAGAPQEVCLPPPRGAQAVARLGELGAEALLAALLVPERVGPGGLITYFVSYYTDLHLRLINLTH